MRFTQVPRRLLVTMLPAVDPRWREIDRRPTVGADRESDQAKAAAT